MKALVRNRPSSPTPIATVAGGRASGRALLCKDRIKKGSRRANKPVGLRTSQPHFHCPTMWRCTSGCLRRNKDHGVVQTLAIFLVGRGRGMLTNVQTASTNGPSDRKDCLHVELRALANLSEFTRS